MRRRFIGLTVALSLLVSSELCAQSQTSRITGGWAEEDPAHGQKQNSKRASDTSSFLRDGCAVKKGEPPVLVPGGLHLIEMPSQAVLNKTPDGPYFTVKKVPEPIITDSERRKKDDCNPADMFIVKPKKSSSTETPILSPRLKLIHSTSRLVD